jgi:hypothetical protein
MNGPEIPHLIRHDRGRRTREATRPSTHGWSYGRPCPILSRRPTRHRLPRVSTAMQLTAPMSHNGSRDVRGRTSNSGLAAFRLQRGRRAPRRRQYAGSCTNDGTNGSTRSPLVDRRWSENPDRRCDALRRLVGAGSKPHTTDGRSRRVANTAAGPRQSGPGRSRRFATRRTHNGQFGRTWSSPSTSRAEIVVRTISRAWV